MSLDSTQKNMARQQLLVQRKRLSLVEVSEASQAIAANALQELRLQGSELVHVYTAMPARNEISCHPLIDALMSRYPRLEVVWGDASRVAPIPSSAYSIIFVPVVGFNRGGFRLGYGGGWYDRFLSSQPQARVIGIAYDWAEVCFIPETHDQPLDMVITQTGAKRF